VLIPFLEDIFDRISCYFPINFEPPADDKFKISPKELKEKLARCFTSSSLLAGLAFPFILDKLGATQIETKLECFSLLQRMTTTYDPVSLIEKHLRIASKHIMNEYFNYYDDQLQRVAAQTLVVIVDRLDQ